jgi:radical SAM protein with 4Fe4S-binding SPASM domain
MKPSDVDIYFEIFTHCRRALGDNAWGRVLAALDEDAAPQQFPQKIDTLRAGTDMPGFGCGAAFNFVALLADGEVHACRKFPSLIGNFYQDRLIDIYNSQLARQYRSGSAACIGCHLWPVCRGCPAVTFSNGLDPFTEKDPFCFLRHEEMIETDKAPPHGMPIAFE